jgi:hypothetical protein
MKAPLRRVCFRCSRRIPTDDRFYLTVENGNYVPICAKCSHGEATGLNVSADGLSIGKAGEFFAASHLLRLGFNTVPLPVDTGVDLLAHRYFTRFSTDPDAAHLLFQFQVKTTTTDEYRASLPSKRVEEFWERGVNLIVVFWRDPTSPSAIVLPPSLLRMLSSGGFKDPRSPLVVTRGATSLRFIKNGERYYIRNRDHDVTPMLNRFDLVESMHTDNGRCPEYAVWSDGGKSLIQFDFDSTGF